MLHEMFTALGLGVFEFLRAWWGRLRPNDPAYTLQGMENLKAAQALGKGVILVSAHFTTLEICVRLLCRDVEINGMYRPHESEALEWAVKKARARYTKQMFSRDELRPALRCLKQGGVLWGILIFLFSWLAGLIFAIMNKTGWMQVGLMILGFVLMMVGGFASGYGSLDTMPATRP